MKKWVALGLLVVLIIWGIYDTTGIKGNRTADNAGPPAPNSSTATTVGLANGNLAPDFQLQTVDGQTIKLSSLRGKKVILNFWATWCPPCKLEVPEIEKFYTQNKAQGIEVIAVDLTNTEKHQSDVPAFIKAYGITYPVLLDTKAEIANLYQAYSIPTTYILDSQGVVRQKVTGPMTYQFMTQTLKAIK